MAGTGAYANAEMNRERFARRWRVGAGVFLIYLAYSAVDLFQHDRPVDKEIAGVGLLASFVLLYLVALPATLFPEETLDGDRWRRRGYLVLGAMTLVTVVYLVVIGGGGLVMLVYLTVGIVPLLPVALSVPLVLAMAAGVTWLPQYVSSWDAHGLQFSTGGPILLAAAAMYAFRRNSVTEGELTLAREEIAKLATEQERLRIARDLHDLLGHALTTVAVKAELASRLAFKDTERAKAEMSEVAALARQSLVDVRATVAGYREMSLAGEIATAREVLAAAGISAELPAAVEGLRPELRELFGWALREGITNVVRHSGAGRVRVTLTDRSIEVVDDGVGCADGSDPGNGLRGLSERAALVRGTVTAGPVPAAAAYARVGGSDPAGAHGGFRLRVEVPS